MPLPTDWLFLQLWLPTQTPRLSQSKALPPEPICPTSWQDEGTARALRLAEHVNVPLYIVHVMSGGAADEVARAKRAGQRVVSEAVASGFAAEERRVWDPDFKACARRAPALAGCMH